MPAESVRPPIRLLRVLSLGAGVIVVLWLAWLGAWLVHIQHLLNPIVRNPAVAVVPGEFPFVPVGPTRPLAADGAVFGVPAWVSGQVSRPAASQWFLGPSDPSGKIPHYMMWGPKESDRSHPLLRSYRQMGGASTTLFDFEKATLSTQPFSAWTVLRSRRGAVRRATLLALKGVFLSDASDAAVGEQAGVGYILIHKRKMTSLFVEDLRAGVGQNFSLGGFADDREIVSAIVSTYRAR